MNLEIPKTTNKRIVIIGGGFAGINVAMHLKKSPFQIVMLDKHNYHTFQPLLYQVATGGLEPTSIAFPLRKVIKDLPNTFFRLAKVEAIRTDDKVVITDIGELHYDILIIATGSTTNFFQLPQESTSKMKTLKSIPQALDLRSYILENFEQALLEQDPERKQALMNVAIVGGGPTGVEMAGAIGEMKFHMLPGDYKELDISKMNIHLFEASKTLLGPMTASSQERALKYVQKFGVQVHLNTPVQSFEGGTLKYGDGQEFPSETVIWTAGVKGEGIQGLPQDAYYPNSRIKVNEYNQVHGFEDIFTIGDVACMVDEKYPRGHPMVAPVAIQQGELLAKNLTRSLRGEKFQAFKYLDKGSMATIGRNKAVVDFPGNKITMGGFGAFVAWMFVHLITLIGFRNKMIVFTGWMYNYFNYDRVLRLIIRPSRSNKR